MKKMFLLSVCFLTLAAPIYSQEKGKKSVVAKKKKESIQASPIAKISASIGRIEYVREKKNTAFVASVGELLESGDTIKVFGNASGEIYFLDEPEVLVQIRENTILKIKKDKTRSIELTTGEIFISFLKTSQDDKDTPFQVSTGTSLSTVKGTEISISTDKEGVDKFICSRGIIKVTAQGQTVIIPAGYASIVRKGEPAQEPFKLLDQVNVKPAKNPKNE
ncbi:MAG TPA: FecR domain-containing protein [Leptospiraceae bacterium]|nr:FecR domain-containing protein [Leptospiraceae bacterium]HRG76669.1 FecR domain-containing protein [Leptospiraceae bacterium]